MDVGAVAEDVLERVREGLRHQRDGSTLSSPPTRYLFGCIDMTVNEFENDLE